MPTIAELEKLVLGLPENDRAHLATRLLESLPAVLSDEDESIEEALRRDAEMDKDPDLGMSLEELDEHMKRLLR